MHTVVLLALTLLAPFPETLNPSQNDVIVRGTVVNWYTQAPLSGATVRAYSAAEGAINTVTDRDGHFVYLKLRPGFYTFDAVKSGFSYSCPFHVDQRASELFAGFQYNVTIVLGPAILKNGSLARCAPG